MNMYRQGDVLLVEVDEIPYNVKVVPPENGRIVLAHGEVTGHHHSFAAYNRVTFFREDGTGNGYLDVNQPIAELTHQEHDTVPVPAKKYRVIQQRQYAPSKAELTAKVQD